MPFTLSHAAAVLPLVRRSGAAHEPLVASALVAGSFSPDIPYFTDTVLHGTFGYGTLTHSRLGVLTVDPVITAVLVGVWLVLREPLVALLPRARQGRAAALLAGRPWRGRPLPPLLCWFWVSAVAGAATHVGWDAFTHPGRAGVRMFPELERTVVAGQPLYLVAQYGSSAAALVVIAGWLWRVVRNAPDRPVPPRIPRISAQERALACTLIAGSVVLAAGYQCWRSSALLLGAGGSPLAVVPTAMFGAGSGLAGGLLLYAVAARVLDPLRPVSGAPGTAPPAGTSAGSASEPCRASVRPGGDG